MLRKLIFIFVLCLAQVTWAQAPAGKSEQSFGPRRQIATIIYMGLGGAVLGLSTLSFYGRPQDHMKNIYLGFGVGVVIGTIYMTYQAATNPTEFYNSGHEPVPLNIKPYEGPIMASASLRNQQSSPLGLKMTWQF